MTYPWRWVRLRRHASAMAWRILVAGGELGHPDCCYCCCCFRLQQLSDCFRSEHRDGLAYGKRRTDPWCCQRTKEKWTIDKRNMNRNTAMRVFVFRNLVSLSVTVLSETVTIGCFLKGIKCLKITFLILGWANRNNSELEAITVS
jgi:hypothetical protein